jgi:hypothetical protein
MASRKTRKRLRETRRAREGLAVASAILMGWEQPVGLSRSGRTHWALTFLRKRGVNTEALMRGEDTHEKPSPEHHREGPAHAQIPPARGQGQKARTQSPRVP